jgi:hypothetical protein
VSLPGQARAAARNLRPRSLIAPVVLVAIAGGCRGPDYYASKAPTEIAEMVQVRLADLGPGEAGYLAPTITGTRSYRLYGSKNLDNGRTTHVLSVDESAMGEHQSLAWARSEAAREVCALSSARLLAGPEGSPGDAATFELADQSISCEPARYCEPVQEVYIEKYKDEHGHTQRRKLYTTVQAATISGAATASGSTGSRSETGRYGTRDTCPRA